MKILYWNQENLLVEFKLLEPGKWLVKLDVDQAVWNEFIVGTPLVQYYDMLPNDLIVRLEFERYAVDPSGYEYFGWIIYTQ
jgi:hypothetical protein